MTKTMLEKLKDVNRRLLEEPEYLQSFVDSISVGMEASRRQRQEFKDSGRFQQVLDYLVDITDGRVVSDNVYQEPLLPGTDKHLPVSNKEFMQTVSMVVADGEPVTDFNPFEEEFVVAFGRRFGMVHGQGTCFYVSGTKD